MINLILILIVFSEFSLFELLILELLITKLFPSELWNPELFPISELIPKLLSMFTPEVFCWLSCNDEEVFGWFLSWSLIESALVYIIELWFSEFKFSLTLTCLGILFLFLNPKP